MAEYRVNLDIYNGPMDLLLYLIRRDEVDIHDIPVARITEQYIQYVDMLQEIDPDIAGEFLVMAATLLEIKTRMLLPAPSREEVQQGLTLDPRAELVRQLLQYKAFKDAASDLAEAADERIARFARRPPVPDADPSAVDLEDVQVWDLVDAFGKLLESIGHRPTHHEVIYDDTPLELLQEDLLDRLVREGPLRFSEVFAGRSRSEMVGLFLAMLELVRLHKIIATQEAPFAEIYLYVNPNPIAATPPQSAAAEGAPPAEPPASQEASPSQPPHETPPIEPSPAEGSEPAQTAGRLDSLAPAPPESPAAGEYVPDSTKPDKPEHEHERGTEDQGTGV